MSKPIEGKVAQILTDYELALNIGSDHGVKQGMKFAIYSNPVSIFDPDTKQKIGETSIEVDRVEVYNVQEKYSLARTYTVTPARTPFSYPTLFKAPTRKKLSVNTEDLVQYEVTIQVGSIATQIVNEE